MDRPQVLIAWHADGLPPSLEGELVGLGFQIQVSRNQVESWNSCRASAPQAVLLHPSEGGAEAAELLAMMELAAAGGGPALIVLSDEPEDLEGHAEKLDDVLAPDLAPRLLARKLRFAIARRAALDRLHGERNRLLQATLTDFKTDLPNDRCFDERCRVEAARAQRDERPLSVLMIDVDRFKALNDDHDHEFGDEVLASVASVLRSGLRPFDVPARMGGDEFAVLLPNTPLRDATRIADRLRQAVARLELRYGERTARTSITVGVASWDPVEGGSFADTRRSADQTLLEAKRLGRDRVGVHTSPSQPTRSAEA